MIKTCTKCKAKKISGQFSKDARKRDGLSSWCKSCAGAATAVWRSANKEKINKTHAAYCAENKERIRAVSAVWREANKEMIHATQAAYIASNPDKMRAKGVAYREKYPDKVRATQAAYRASNLEKRLIYAAAYRSANKEKNRARIAEWSAANPEKKRINNHNYRAIKRAAGGKLSKDLTANLLKLQRGKCACCGQILGDDIHLDHILPLALGGSNTDDNIQLLRSLCNQRKHAKHPIDFMQEKGFLL